MQSPVQSLVLPLLLTTLAILAACGGGSEGPPPLPKPAVGSVSGTVSDPQGRPLGRVSVMASGTRSELTSTDDAGKFQLTTLPAGPYSLSFSLEGYEDSTLAVQVPADWDIHILVKMIPVAPPIGAISGQVSDSFGTLLTGVTVVASGAGQGFTSTNAAGQFQFLGLPAGSYSLNFSLDGFESRSEATQVNGGQTTRLQVQLAPQSLPSAGTRGVRITSHGSTRLEFEVDVLVLHANGTPLGGLGSGAFTLRDFADLHFERLGLSAQPGTDVGPYSAVLLMDQSASILSTDPTDSRIQAGKIFFQALSAPDTAQLSAFASGGLLPYAPITLWGSFTSAGSSFYGSLDTLAHLEGGGTPLYASTAALVEHVTSQGHNPNRAVVVFTDGEDTDGSWSLQNVISLARSRNVKLFTVGLSNGINFQVLSQMAAQTQGAMLWASDARQLISIYGSLGNLLRGAAQFYRTRWSATRSSGTWTAGTWFSMSVEVQTPSGLLSAPFYVEIPSSGLLPQVTPNPLDGASCRTGPATGNRPVLCLAQ
ncbi:carboxypeptidase regulatory-like domain-containing protein [Hyalangium sp.]|uniref:carboxypeptidase regulatory-like domain-containing protein n=1 Tax=Hyalangium sp. TaxID=2028555 RepID=UPI002D3693B3|nr:carboxypeptidase regulatory-like domain-containing protein [Hyalangium sp.]HYH96811.1 carboxypeptidase regulatory-like domain-containing protein [Hyalangium sp.]